MRNSYYQAKLSEFADAQDSFVLGELTKAHGFALEHQQRQAWLDQIALLKEAMPGLPEGHILFEFVIPRMGKRADTIIVWPHAVILIEFKVGAETFDRAAIDQAHDYALDLKNFHSGSHASPIIPTVAATKAVGRSSFPVVWAADAVAAPVLIGTAQLGAALQALARCKTSAAIDYSAWVKSGYKPTPTIVEAAQALFQQHGVEEITRSDAGAQNLGVTTFALERIIERAKAENAKTICFVTGVPGAGKTLAGLNIATTRAQHHSDEHAVFLSGNGPLVDVLREALSRDESKRKGVSKSEATRRVAGFVQNIHHFRDEALRDQKPPVERVVIFDEAQRAWTRDQASKFMKAKRGVSDFDMSEPDFLISVMNRHSDWCVIICLIGGGQEINTGEAGLSEWIDALRARYQSWKVHVSDQLSGEDYLRPDNEDSLAQLDVTPSRELHLSVSMRSFRAESLSNFVGHVVNNRADEARTAYGKIADRYPIVLTRNLDQAREWLRGQARGSERYGLLASSGALRLRPEGIHIKAKIDPPAWFLNDCTDVRSSFYCEEVATEFDVQGLELDWAGVCWDADFRYGDGCWRSFDFKGSKWQTVRSTEAVMFLKNAYRVILTRARQGMTIFIPRGDAADSTRPPEYYSETAKFLECCGIRCVDSVT